MNAKRPKTNDRLKADSYSFQKSTPPSQMTKDEDGNDAEPYYEVTNVPCGISRSYSLIRPSLGIASGAKYHDTALH
jgi:hypothetical protein